MIPDRCLYFAGIFFSFFLQITAAYLTCSLVNRALNNPRQRFRVLIGLLSVAAIYWLGLIVWNVRSILASPAAAASDSGTPISRSQFLVPLSWSSAVLTAGKAVLIGYVGAVAVLMAINLWRQIRLWMLLRQGWTPSEAIVLLFEQICREFGVTRCEILVLPGLSSPATAGWLHPRVLLPVLCDHLGPNERLADVLRHEVAHVASRDYFWASLSDLICRILFFHPALWRAKKLARLQGELACDMAVVEAQPDRRADYADSLAYFVRLRMMQEQAAVGIDFAAAPSSLGTRIRFILAGSPVLPWWKRIPRRAAAVALLSAFAIVAPALSVSLGFSRPLPPVGLANPGAKPVSMRHHTSVSDSVSPLPPVTDLNTLRTKASFQDTAYSANRGYERGRSDSSRGFDRPWREPGTSVKRPSVTDVIGSAVAIAVSLPDHDRDHDKHLLP